MVKSSFSIAVLMLLCGSLCVATRAAAPKKGATHAVSIKDMAFDPTNVEVNVGDTVEWTNNDVRDHTVVARDGSFSSGNIGSGETYRFTFKKAGKFSYSCSLHPRMKGQVSVSAS